MDQRELAKKVAVAYMQRQALEISDLMPLIHDKMTRKDKIQFLGKLVRVFWDQRWSITVDTLTSRAPYITKRQLLGILKTSEKELSDISGLKVVFSRGQGYVPSRRPDGAGAYGEDRAGYSGGQIHVSKR